LAVFKPLLADCGILVPPAFFSRWIVVALREMAEDDPAFLTRLEGDAFAEIICCER
jgi:hypothetical protein